MSKALAAMVFGLTLGLFGTAGEASAQVCIEYGNWSNSVNFPGSYLGTEGENYYTCSSPNGRIARVWMDTGCQLGFGCRRAAARRQTGSCTNPTSAPLQVSRTVLSTLTGWVTTHVSSHSAVCGTSYGVTESGTNWVTTAKCRIANNCF